MFFLDSKNLASNFLALFKIHVKEKQETHTHTHTWGSRAQLAGRMWMWTCIDVQCRCSLL